jgi:tRNA(His) 5'-end guanylyltransferase
VPPHDVPNVFIWRQRDAMKNSVSAFAQHHFARSELHKKTSGDRVKMLLEKGVDWKKLPSWQRWGTGAMRKNYIVNGVERSRWEAMEIPNFSKEPGLIKQFLEEPTMPPVKGL